MGVRLRFQTEIGELSDLAREGIEAPDLVVAADGVNSGIRRRYAAAFRPSLDVRTQARYIWLGTRLPFEAFTFIILENEHGVFQVHGYRFDEDWSTFIVECDQASWANAGLDRATPTESIAYLERLFAGHLQGEKLLANKSDWINFVTVRNATWRHENVVLLGDAAHTAHFSIGSGTKLALEDAIALAKAFRSERSIAKALEETGANAERRRYFGLTAFGRRVARAEAERLEQLVAESRRRQLLSSRAGR